MSTQPTKSTATDGNVLKGIFTAFAIILIVFGNIFGTTYFFDWINTRSGVWNIIGILSFLAMLVIDYFLLKALFKSHTKNEQK